MSLCRQSLDLSNRLEETVSDFKQMWLLQDGPTLYSNSSEGNFGFFVISNLSLSSLPRLRPSPTSTSTKFAPLVLKSSQCLPIRPSSSLFPASPLPSPAAKNEL